MSVEKMSKLLCWLLLVPMLFIPVMWIYFFLRIENFKMIAQSNVSYAIQWNTVEYWQLYLVCSISVIPAAVLLWGLLNLRSAFNAFSNGMIFATSNIISIKRFALALLLSAILSTISSAIASVLLSQNHPAGEKLLSIQFSSNEISTFLIGTVFWLIAKILIRAYMLEQENQQFV